MSRREASVQPFLPTLMRGEPMTLDYEQVCHLAVWTVLRASAIDLVQSETKTLTPQYRRLLIDTARVSRGTRVWAGRLPEPAAAAWLQRVVHGDVVWDDGVAESVEMLYSTLWIGKLFLLATVNVDLASVASQLSPLISLWPPSTEIHWSPAEFATDDQARFLKLILDGTPEPY
jgi:hypothetical protein